VQSLFSFRQFQLLHNRQTLKVNTASLLLGALASCQQPGNYLDIGTGSGILALMMAQRNPQAFFTAIEPDFESFKIAAANFSASPWHSRLVAHHCSLETFKTTQRFRGIVCNPPFFENSLHSPDAAHIRTRHASTLHLDMLLHHCAQLLDEQGSASILVPAGRKHELINFAHHAGLFPQKIFLLQTTAAKPPALVMAVFSRCWQMPEEQTMVVRNAYGYTQQYRSLLAPYLPSLQLSANATT
jgi:tRNA1Val (adenine37-N6)-methyltransferase